MKHFALLLLLFISTALSAQKQVDTIAVNSPSMKEAIRNVVILPADYERQNAFPVLYLLHGYSGRYDSWLSIKPDLPKLATEKGMIIVCPDGKNNWYWDSPANPKVRYETYVSNELVSYIDNHYKTVRSKKGRAVTGLSMGGHGGLWLGIRHPDVFGACGSTSGGVDIRPFPYNWEMSKQLGSYKENPERWDAHTVMTQLYKIQPDSLAIIIDCGTEDFFFDVNEKLHKELLYRNIKHDYLTRPGAHNAAYWNNSIEYQVLFFSNFFKKNKE